MPLGVLPLNENKNNEMVEIMLHAHQYVPTRSKIKQVDVLTGETASVTEVQMHSVMFGGDQLTAARARGAKKSRANSTTLDKCLSGLEPYVQDWHAKVIFLEVRNMLLCITVKGESFTGLNFCSFRNFSKKRKVFPMNLLL